MGFEMDEIVRLQRQVQLNEGRIMCIRLGNALQMAAALHIPAPAAPGAVESLERGVYELRRAHPHLQWDAHPPHGSVQAKTRQWLFTLCHQVPRRGPLMQPVTGWHCVVDLFDVDGTGLRAMRFESGVCMGACTSLQQATDRAEEQLSYAMGELRNE